MSTGASGVPSECVGSGPDSTGAPCGRVSVVTAFSSPSAATCAAWPRLGPNPARQSSRSACAAPNVPLYFAIGESTVHDGGAGGAGGGVGTEPPGGCGG